MDCHTEVMSGIDRGIATIVVCLNDGYKLDEWEVNYNEYKESIYRLIIVDNGSKQSFIEEVKKRFKEATLIENGINLGTTGAYNVGIKEALGDPNVKKIMLIANDIRISVDSVRKMSHELDENDEIGMVAPVLLYKDSDVIEDCGDNISYCLILKPRYKGLRYDKVKNAGDYCQTVTGGMSMASTEFYKQVGPQDKELFMYSDEVDMGIRSMKKGYRIKIVGDSKAWHQHIDKHGKRPSVRDFLVARNKVYLGYKHFGRIRAWTIAVFFMGLGVYKSLHDVLQGRGVAYGFSTIEGAIHGIIGDMNIPTKYKMEMQGE